MQLQPLHTIAASARLFVVVVVVAVAVDLSSFHPSMFLPSRVLLPLPSLPHSFDQYFASSSPLVHFPITFLLSTILHFHAVNNILKNFSKLLYCTNKAMLFRGFLAFLVLFPIIVQAVEEAEEGETMEDAMNSAASSFDGPILRVQKEEVVPRPQISHNEDESTRKNPKDSSSSGENESTVDNKQSNSASSAATTFDYFLVVIFVILSMIMA